MPEGDTVWRTARRLDQALAGERLTSFDLRWPSLALLDYTGTTTTEVRARGKHILHRLDNGTTLHSHLRMEGQWRIEHTSDLRAGSLRNSHIRAVLATSDWTAVGRRLGMLDVVPTSEEATLVGHLGPDVLGPDWDSEAALANLASDATAQRTPTIGAALLDQRNLAGIGTMYAAETLFLTRVDPWQHPSLTPADQLRTIIDTAVRLLTINRDFAVQSTTGIRRKGLEMYVHARSGRPCRRCGTPIRVDPIGAFPTQRVMFYCPSCQMSHGSARSEALSAHPVTPSPGPAPTSTLPAP